jgi:multiple sugar transport system permease protein
MIAVTFRFIDAAKLFDIIYSLTRGGPGTQTYTTSYYLYQQGFELFHLGQGVAGAWMFTIMLSFISFFLVRRLMKTAEEEAGL